MIVTYELVCDFEQRMLDACEELNEWNNSNYNYHFLKAGLIHLTPEAAELHAKALLSFTACATAST